MGSFTQTYNNPRLVYRYKNGSAKENNDNEFNHAYLLLLSLLFLRGTPSIALVEMHILVDMYKNQFSHPMLKQHVEGTVICPEHVY